MRLMTKNYDFHGLKALADRKIMFQKHFRCADEHCGKADMTRRTCFREQYYTGMRRYYCGMEDCRPRPKKTIYKNMMVFH